MATFVTIVAGLAAILLLIKNRIALGVAASAVTAVALFIAFPVLLTSKSIGRTGTWIICLIGVIIVLGAVATKHIPTAAVLLGILVVTWALFRNIPTFPPAFAHLGPRLGKATTELWDAWVSFFKEASGGKAH